MLIHALGFGLFFYLGAGGKWLFAFISIFGTFTLSVVLEYIGSRQ